MTNKRIVLKVKLFDKTLPKPKYQSDGAAAIDLYARTEVKIAPGQIGYIPLNIAIQLPENHWALISARSSLHKRGLLLANGIGVGDYDFRGANDEYKAPVFNFTDSQVTIEKAERVVQMIIMNREPVNVVIENDFDSKDRGGFGSTGRK